MSETRDQGGDQGRDAPPNQGGAGKSGSSGSRPSGSGPRRAGNTGGTGNTGGAGDAGQLDAEQREVQREPPSAFPAQPPARGRSSGATAVALPRGAVKSIHYTLSYVVQNAAAGPRGAVVLLHDLPGGAFSWEGVLPGLAASGRAIYAFDMLGYGQSEHPWPSDTSNWGHADCLQYALRALGLTEITLVGIGLGGAVAQVLATRLYREEVARLVLINSYAYSMAYAPDWPLSDMLKRHDPELPRHTPLDQLMGELRNTLPRGAVNALPAARLGAYVAEWNSELGKEMLFQHIRLMLPDYVNAVSTNVELLQTPALLLWGERDTVTPVTLAQRIASANPNARVQVVPGAGHLLLDDAPGAVANAIAGFIA
jgi:pimeloyl-ACP methyl ester carboxylesterase